jgi:hypothetical protein
MLPSQHDLRVVDDVEREDDGSDTRVNQVQDPALYTKLHWKNVGKKLQVSIKRKHVGRNYRLVHQRKKENI